MKKRFLSVFLALALCFGLCAVPAFAADSDFLIEDGVLTYYKGSGGDVVIPDGVKAIAGHTVGENSRDGGIFIGAFRECTNLTSVTIPNSVTWIAQWAFLYCTNLTSVTIGTGVTCIESEAFEGCTSLINIYYGGTKEQWDAISIDDENETLKTATIHFNAAAPAFTDVAAGAFYADAVNWAVGKDITNGTGDNRFSPGQDCTHAQILTFLYRAARGKGAASAADMDKAAAWAEEKGMIGAGFNPSAKCTRADAVNYIWQAFGKESAPAGSFTDVSGSAAYAKAVDWAVANGITNGTGGDKFSPDTVCTRGHIVTFLHRAYVPEARLK